MDGSLGSSTAMFFEPYVQDPSTSGLYVIDPDVLKQQMLEGDSMGFQLAIHSIGDKSNSDLLDMFHEIIKTNGPRDRRFRVEHAQHMDPKDFKRFADLDVIASMQPYHAIDDGRFAEGRIGAKRCETTYAFKSFLDNGVTLALGSDLDVAPLDAILGIYAAVTRRTLDGKHPDGWYPEQKITLEEARIKPMKKAIEMKKEGKGILAGKATAKLKLTRIQRENRINESKNYETLFKSLESGVDELIKKLKERPVKIAEVTEIVDNLIKTRNEMVESLKRINAYTQEIRQKEGELKQ